MPFMASGEFRGGPTGFVKGRYIISPVPLGGDDYPNYSAKRIGEEVRTQFRHPPSNINSTYGRFISLLKQIQQQEFEKEKRYLKLKLEKLRNLETDNQFLSLLESRINSEDFSGAYTLLQKRTYDLKAFLIEARKDQFNPAKSTEFRKSLFGDFIKNFLKDKIETEKDKVVLKIVQNENATVDSLVEDFFKEQLSTGYVLGIDQAKKEYSEKLLQLFKEYNILPKGATSKSFIFTPGRKTRKFTNIKVPLKKEKAIKVNETIKKIFDQVKTGLVTELQGATKASSDGTSIAITTGGFRKDYHGNVQIKADWEAFEVFSGTLDIDSIIQQANKDLFDPNAEKDYQAFLQNVQQMIDEGEELFRITTNTKGYQSNFDLQIEGKGSFENRMDNLLSISQGTNSLTYDAVDKLIFLMNNTVEGAIADKSQHLISTYIGALCAGYMWDDYTNIFKKDIAPNGITTIHLFQQGTGYFPLSQIMKITISQLENLGTNPSSFVDVEITPASFDFEKQYIYIKNLKENILPEEAKGKPDIYEPILQRRWDYIRNLGLKDGMMSVHFKQTELEKLLENLTGALRSVKI